MKPLLIAAVLLLSGCTRLVPSPPLQTLHYQCGTMPLTVNLHMADRNESVSFLLDGELHTLYLVVASSGSRYSDGKYTFWRKQQQALIMRGERIIVNDCVLR